MHALQPITPTPQPPRRSRTATQPRPQPKRHPHRAIVIETSIKLTVNVVLSTVAISALTHLVPYIDTQKTKLAEVQAAVKSTHDRLQHTQARFSRYFDPYQTKVLMQEQSDRVDPNQRQVLLEGLPETAPTEPPAAIATEAARPQEKARGY